MKNKVYVVTPDLTGLNWAEQCRKAMQLDADIQRLAKKSGDTSVHMCAWNPPVPGSPTVLVECSEAFLEKIKKLPLFDAAVPAALPTIRRSDMPQIEAPESMTPPPKGPKRP
ncbi:MAG: hypothetical protein ACAH83_17410 [Alphaproteobacteria bacterium]